MGAETSRGTVRRRDLDRKLDAIFEHRAGEVTGPAGSGKTAWLRSWSGATRCADVAWVTLDTRHRDPQVLVTDLVASVHEATSAPGAPQDVPFERVVEHVRSSTERSGRRLVIVADAAESLAEDGTCAVLSALLATEHEGFRVVLAGRSLPEVGLEALRRSQSLLIVSAADLRLSEPETAEIVRSAMRSEPSDDDLTAVHRQIDGWALGAALAGLALEHSGSVGPARIEGIAGHRYFDEYFESEVYESLPTDIRSFLLDICVVAELDPDLCAEISGRSDALALLRRLERDNVFIEWLGGRPPTFRLHSLLRSWLRDRLDRCSPHRSAELSRRAAAWFERRDRFAEAIEQRLAAGDTDAAVSLIVEHGPSALGEGRYRAIVSWIGALPPHLVTSNAPLLILRVEAEHRIGDAEAATATWALSRALAARRPAAPLVDHYELTVAVQRATELHRNGRLEAGAEQARRAYGLLDLASARSLDDERTFDDLLVAMDVVSIAGHFMFIGEFAESARLARWVTDSLPAGDRDAAAVRIRALGQHALTELLRGARTPANELAREALAMCRFHRLDPIEVGLAEMVLLVVGPVGDRAALEAALDRRLAQVDLSSYAALVAMLRTWSYVQSSDLDAARRALAEADREIARLEELAVLGPLRRRVGAMLEVGVAEPVLGRREREVLAALAAGGSRRDVADRLHLSLNTVKSYAQHAYRRLGATSLADALARCDALGIELDS